MAVEDISRVKEILERLSSLDSMYVKVGILSATDGQLLMIANVHEFGCDIKVTDKMRGYFLYHFGIALKPSTKVIKIPERSYVRSSYDKHQGDIGLKGDELIQKVVDGGLSVRGFYDLLGQTSADAIRNFLISEVKSPPNSALTISKKGGKSNPLVNTGRLANAIDYEIVGG